MTATHTPGAPQAKPAAAPAPHRSEAGGIAMMIGGSLAALVAVALLFAAGTLLYYDTQRDSAGYVSTDMTAYSTGTYAIASDSYVAGRAGDVFVPADLLGKIRVRARDNQPLFIGIGPAGSVDAYLRGVAHEQVSAFAIKRSDTHVARGGAPAAPPTAQTFWAAQTTGTGDRSITWQSRHGDWRIVLMRPDGSRSLNADVAVGAQFPHIVRIGLLLLAGALLVGTSSALLIRSALLRLKR